jgi:hypothetical protein
MAETFDRNSCARRLIEAGTAPETAAQHAALIEECVVNALASKADVAELISHQKSFTITLKKMDYFKYLEALQYRILIGALGVVGVILAAILAKLLKG